MEPRARERVGDQGSPTTGEWNPWVSEYILNLDAKWRKSWPFKELKRGHWNHFSFKRLADFGANWG